MLLFILWLREWLTDIFHLGNNMKENVDREKMIGTYIVIPTYQEVDGVQKVISNIMNVDKDLHIIIVDDNSPDGTAELVRSLKNNNIFVIVRSGKLGIGSAIIEGMKRSLLFSDCRFVVTMDSDMSHDPASIPSLLAKLDECDMVQGSRFILGGKDVGRTWHRRFISNVANFLYRIIFSLDQKEITTSFRAYSRRCVEIVVANAKTKTYEFSIESALIIKDHHLKVTETPIIFVDRNKGKSKLNIKELISSSMFLITTILFRFRRIFKFGMVGAAGIIVNQGILWVLTDSFWRINLYYLYASIIAIELSILSNFLFNNFFTFSDASREKWFIRLFKYNLTCAIGLILNMMVLWSFTEGLHIYYLISNLMGIIIAFLWNYSVSFKWVWGKKEKGDNSNVHIQKKM